MMRISPRDRLMFKDSLRDTRVFGRTIAYCLPTFTECQVAGCGYDELHDSGINPSCAVCNGLGRTASSWSISQVFANVRIVDEMMITFRQAPPGSELGQTFISIGVRDYDMTKKVFESKDAYMWVDNSALRPKSIEVVGVGHIEEYVVLMSSFQPAFRAPGY